ncbi:hypothetical protein [Exiguobacterium sp. s59]|uniref:hypothetical protein n=1 Tax=Exiguobacterium sp. s59 TaxID=2751269 RepID=UPI001BEC8DCE|nr:hypothetical protein [Exiguobacterium sp. s59]
MLFSTEFLSGLIGAIVGGVFSLLGSHYEVKRQSENQKLIDAENKLEARLLALNSIKMEITHNINQAEMFRIFLEEEEVDRLVFSEVKFISNFHSYKWSRHSDIIGMINYPTLVEKAESFYANVHLTNATNTIFIEGAINLSEKGNEVVILINDTIKILQENCNDFEVSS